MRHTYWQPVSIQIGLDESDHMWFACMQSACVGVSIIIYFYVFNLTTCCFKTAQS